SGLPVLLECKLGRGLDVDAAGDSADFNAAAGSAEMSAKGMLVLVLDHDGEIGADFPGDGFGGKIEASVFGNRNFDAAAGCFQMPITVARRIAGDFDAAGGRTGFNVVASAGNDHSAAGGFSIDAPSGSLDRDRAG